MLLKVGILSIVFLTSQIGQSLADKLDCKNLASITVCLENKTLEVAISPDDLTCKVIKADNPSIRDGYVFTPGLGHYKYHAEGKSWNEARKTCIAEGGDLAVTASEVEHHVVKNLQIKHNKPNTNVLAWLGAHNLFDHREWTTVQGQLLYASGFTAWSKGCNGSPPQPDNFHNNEHCLSLISNPCEHGWNDYNCDSTMPFICQIPDACS